MNVMSANPIHNESDFAEAALTHWRQLGQELRADVEKSNLSGGPTSFVQPVPNEYRISNSATGLEVRVVADLKDRLAHYEFTRTNDHSSAGAPEGGILSMRAGRNGVEFYSSDRPLTALEARSLLLDPVLNPTTT